MEVHREASWRFPKGDEERYKLERARGGIRMEDVEYRRANLPDGKELF